MKCHSAVSFITHGTSSVHVALSQNGSASLGTENRFRGVLMGDATRTALTACRVLASTRRFASMATVRWPWHPHANAGVLPHVVMRTAAKKSARVMLDIHLL